MAQPYRDDLAALSEKLRQVEEELSHILRAEARRDELTREAAVLRARVEAARIRGPLEDLRIASPCNARWEDMAGDDRVRHCARCDKNVYNVSGMSRAEAVELLRGRAGQPTCVRMFKRADGTVLTSDCPVGAKQKRVRRLVMYGTIAAAAGVAAVWAGREEPVVMTGEAPLEQWVMGTKAAPEPSTSSSTVAPATTPQRDADADPGAPAR